MAIKTTQKLLFALVILLTLLALMQACKKSAHENVDLTGSHILKKEVTKILRANEQTIELMASDFEITGCPPYMNCLVGGYSKVTLKFKDSHSEQTLILCKGLCALVAKPIQAVVTLNGIKYNVKLEEILPEYNGEKTTIETPKAYIVITKVDS